MGRVSWSESDFGLAGKREPSVLVLTSKLCVVEFLAGALSTFNKSRDSLMPSTTRSSFWQSQIPRENEL